MEEKMNSSRFKTEHVLTAEKITEFILNKSRASSHKELNKIEDERGLYLLEIEIPGDDPGDTDRYVYKREGDSPGKGAFKNPEIHVTYFSDGIPVSGVNVAQYIEESWKMIVAVNEYWLLESGSIVKVMKQNKAHNSWIVKEVDWDGALYDEKELPPVFFARQLTKKRAEELAIELFKKSLIKFFKD